MREFALRPMGDFLPVLDRYGVIYSKTVYTKIL